MSQPQPRHGARRAFGVINANSTPRKVKGGASSIADEVHSAKKDNKHQAGPFSMATRSSKKRAATLKEAEEKEVAAAAVESPSKTAKTAAVLPKIIALKEEACIGEEHLARGVFRAMPEVDAAFWDEMEDLLEIKLANPINSQDEFDVSSNDGDEDEQLNLKDEVTDGGDE